MAVSQLNDLKVKALRQLGYLDKQLNVNECLFWKTFSNKTEYDDLKKAWLASLGFNKPTLVDSYYAYLRSQGYTGSIPDMEFKSLSAGTLYFSPLTLFAAGEQGAWYDPSDLSTLFQDSAGTTPVTAVGQPVGKMNDKSGRGNHVIQATAASRPVLQKDGTGRYYLACDGVDDGMATAGNVDFSATDKVTICTGLLKQSDAAFNAVFDLSAVPDSTANSFNLGTGTSSGDASRRTYGVFHRGSATQSSESGFIYASPHKAVVTGALDRAQATPATQIIMRVNGANPSGVAYPGTPAESGNYRNDVVYLFRRGGTVSPFTGNFYGLVVRGAASSASQISQLEAYMNAKTGAF